MTSDSPTLSRPRRRVTVRVGKGRQAFDPDEDVQIVLVHLIQVIGEAASGYLMR
jgi:hypothetical protein